MKKWDYDNIQSIKVVVSKTNYAPIYYAKLEEMVEEGFCKTIEEAEGAYPFIEFDLELYYEKGLSLFAVDTYAVESCEIYSPYTGEEVIPFEL